MLSGFKNLFRSPVFDDLEKNAQARSIHAVLFSTLVLTLLFLLYAVFNPVPGQLIIAGTAIVFEFGLLVMVQAKQIRLASGLLTFFLWVAIAAEVALYGGIRDTGFSAFAAVIIIAGLTMGARAGLIYAALTLATAIGLAIAETQGWLPPYTNQSITSIIFSHGITIIAVALLLNLAIRSIATVAQKALQEEKAQEEINKLLEASRAELQQHATVLEQRTATLQTATEISRLTSQTKNEKELLKQSAQLLVERIKLEYAGIFLLDQTEENVILQISSSQENKPLVATGYKLRVLRSEVANILLGTDSLHFQIGKQNYYIERPAQLADMKTNVIFPLASGEQLLGLMNIQTASPDPQHIDQQALQTFADQIALSIQNIRLLDQLQSRIQEISTLAGDTVRSAWEQVGNRGTIGYQYDRIHVLPTDETFPPEIARQLFTGKSMSFVTGGASPRARLVSPIILRENVIGVIGYDNDDARHEWQAEEKAFLEAVALRVGLALENTRLVAEAQQRAITERTVGEISSKISGSVNLRNVLRTTVQELGRALPETEIIIQLQSDQGKESN